MRTDTIDPAQKQTAGLRRVMAQYPTGVVVITGEVEGRRVGLACNSFTSVSLEPPLISFCAARSSTTWPHIRQSGEFCVNFMSGEHRDVVQVFAQREVDRFATGHWSSRRCGPGLCDAIAWLDCRIWSESAAGDHTIVLGQVLAMDIHPRGAVPLVFWRGSYGSVDHSPKAADED